MLKRIVLFLLMLSPFMFSSAWTAERTSKPKIITINGRLVADEDAVDSIIESLDSTGIKVEKEDNKHRNTQNPPTAKNYDVI